MKEMKAQGYDLGDAAGNIDGEALVAALKVRLTRKKKRVDTTREGSGTAVERSRSGILYLDRTPYVDGIPYLDRIPCLGRNTMTLDASLHSEVLRNTGKGATEVMAVNHT